MESEAIIELKKSRVGIGVKQFLYCHYNTCKSTLFP